LAVLAIATPVVVSSTGAQAVHDDGLFELEGNTVNAATPGDDWGNLYNGGGAPDNTVRKCTALITTNCFDTFALDADGSGSADTSYFTGGGSKDRNDIAQWQWTVNDQTPDKNDIVNALAAAYRDDNSLVLYFGADRFAVNGDAQMGFWFNQAPMCRAGTNGTCPATTPNQVTNQGKFVDPDTGAPVHHLDGDILALVNFNQGGSLGLAGVYQWQGGITGAPVQVLTGTGADCKTIPTGDNFCSTTNINALPGEPPWPYVGKGKDVTTYPGVAFIEGGIDLGAIAGAGTCFPSFLAETRSSSGPSTGLSLDAQLKDFALRSFQLCGSGLVTTPKDGAGNAIPAGGLSIGTGSVSATDSAQLDVTGISTWTGTLAFFLCGPIPTGTCDTGGTQIGSTQTVTNATTQPVLSAAATITSVGRYCWRGVFTSGTAGVPSRTDSSPGECFTVNPVQTQLDTQAVASTVDFGQAVQDNATLSGTANRPGSPIINGPLGPKAGGTITFTLLKADCTTLATGTGTNPQTVNVSGDGTYGPVSYTPDAPGTYHWTAVYTPASGDPNNLGSNHNLACNDTDETVVVRTIPTLVDTRQSVFPQDKARVSVNNADPTSGGALAGSVTFQLYDTLANCQAGGATGVLYTEGPIAISGASPQFAATNNTSVRVAIDATVVWRVTYTSTNQAHDPSSSACVESTAVDFTGDDGTIAIP
jgi:hypothetical protein